MSTQANFSSEIDGAPTGSSLCKRINNNFDEDDKRHLYFCSEKPEI